MQGNFRFLAKLGLLCLMTLGMFCLQQIINSWIEYPSINEQLMTAAEIASACVTVKLSGRHMMPPPGSRV